VHIDDGESGVLNPIAVNCLRTLPLAGAVSWGARTAAGADELASQWKYIPVRRTALFIEESVRRGTQWAVFEPNDLALWERVKRTLNAYLRTLWREGALFGASPAEAFFVKCDAENNPPESIDLGRLIVEVGIAPVKPAEFVIFRISQWQGGSAASE
jgi:phage tail sheath protein FI